jgi:hypothetical protein
VALTVKLRLLSMPALIRGRSLEAETVFMVTGLSDKVMTIDVGVRWSFSTLMDAIWAG